MLGGALALYAALFHYRYSDGRSRIDRRVAGPGPVIKERCARRRGTFAQAIDFSSSFREDCMATEARETATLIGSDKVEGTAVYGADDQKIGSIERVMIEKTSGSVSYAVLSFGGFLGIGNDYYPLPWHHLRYDKYLGGYRIDVTEDELKAAPKYEAESSWDWAEPGRTQAVDDYYAGPK
jgi:hypothetical protein